MDEWPILDHLDAGEPSQLSSYTQEGSSPCDATTQPRNSSARTDAAGWQSCYLAQFEHRGQQRLGCTADGYPPAVQEGQLTCAVVKALATQDQQFQHAQAPLARRLELNSNSPAGIAGGDKRSQLAVARLMASGLSPADTAKAAAGVVKQPLGAAAGMSIESFPSAPQTPINSHGKDIQPKQQQDHNTKNGQQQQLQQWLARQEAALLAKNIPGLQGHMSAGELAQLLPPPAFHVMGLLG